METFYVFQHSLAVITDGHYLPLMDILQQRDLLGSIKADESALIGNSCLFKLDQHDDGLIYGRLTGDVDQRSEINSTELYYYEFPKAEYLFTIHNGPFEQLSQVYDNVKEELDEKGLNAIFHPILVFPQNLPSDITSPTTIEIWIATDSDIDAPDNRLSDDLEEALPRTSFNFWTW